MLSKDRGVEFWLGLGVVVALVGGALLGAYVIQVAHNSRDFICAFGKAEYASPVKQRAEETDGEFRRRVHTARQFVNELNRLQDCNPPALIRIHPESKPALQRANKRSQGDSPRKGSNGAQRAPTASGGGGNQTPANPPSQPPTPPPPGGGGHNGGNDPPPDGDGLLDEVNDAVCGLTPNGLPILCR